MPIDSKKVEAFLLKKVEKALLPSMILARAKLIKRIESGTSTTGRVYSYQDRTAKKKGKRRPVDWTDTGTLLRSIDFVMLKKGKGVQGLLGIQNLPRGRADNKTILQSLVKRYPNLYALTKKEIEEIKNYFFKKYKQQ